MTNSKWSRALAHDVSLPQDAVQRGVTPLPDPPYPSDLGPLPFPIKAFVAMAVKIGMDAHEAECFLRIHCRDDGMEIFEGDL